MRRYALWFLMGLVIPFQTIGQEAPVGKGSVDEPFRIATEAHLRWLATRVATDPGMYCEQVADITVTVPLTPIGTKEYPFKGSYNGQDYWIDGLQVEGVGYVGLFGYAEGAIFERVRLSVSRVEGTGSVGALVGEMVNGELRRCVVEREEEGGKVAGEGVIGGMVGRATGARLEDLFCRVEVEVSGGEQPYAGGLVGAVVGPGMLVRDSHAWCEVRGSEAGQGQGGAFGLVEGEVRLNDLLITSRVWAGETQVTDCPLAGAQTGTGAQGQRIVYRKDWGEVEITSGRLRLYAEGVSNDALTRGEVGPWLNPELWRAHLGRYPHVATLWSTASEERLGQGALELSIAGKPFELGEALPLGRTLRIVPKPAPGYHLDRIAVNGIYYYPDSAAYEVRIIGPVRVRVDYLPGTPVYSASLALQAYPNPATGELFVVSGCGDGGLYMLYALDGRVVRHGRWVGDSLRIDLSGLVPGSYLLEVRGRNGERGVLPFLKQ